VVLEQVRPSRAQQQDRAVSERAGQAFDRDM